MPLWRTSALVRNRGRTDTPSAVLALGDVMPPRSYHKLTLTLLKASWRRALRLVAQRRSAITKVAAEMLAAPEEKITGACR